MMSGSVEHPVLAVRSVIRSVMGSPVNVDIYQLTSIVGRVNANVAVHSDWL